MDEFPKMLVRFPGAMERLQDGVYDVSTVRNAEEEAALGEGWAVGTAAARALADAREAALKAAQEAEAEAARKAQEEADKTAPPTREELEAKAKELGVKFDGRTGDAKLSALIEEKLKGAE